MPGEKGGRSLGVRISMMCLHLIPLLESLPQTDTSRTGMYGWSRGGLMTYLALTKTHRIRAAVIGGGMSDAFDTVRGDLRWTPGSLPK